MKFKSIFLFIQIYLIKIILNMDICIYFLKIIPTKIPINKPYTTIKTFLIDKLQTFKLLTIFAI